jgi:uncharacterized protein (TIGR02301 family)
MSVLLAALTAAPAPGAAQDFFRRLFGAPSVAPQEPEQPQSAPLPTRTGLPPSMVRREGATPPYESDMSRLAEILGALHFLRPLCGAAEDNRWRDEMQDIIEAESPAAERRDRLIASFNRSYVAYGQTYRSCTPSAGLAIRRYLDEGARLSREIATKYGN